LDGPPEVFDRDVTLCAVNRSIISGTWQAIKAKITPLHGRISHDDMYRVSLGNVVENGLDDAGVRNQAIHAGAGEVVVMHPVGLYHTFAPS
jgi:hypothetical protein